MSQVSTFIQAKDGKFYQNPIIVGDGFYAYFDTDEGNPEIVLRHVPGKSKKEFLEDAQKKLKEANIENKLLSSTFQRQHSRCFPPDWEIVEAVSFSFHILAPIPIPIEFDSVVEYPSIDCRYYCWHMDFDTETLVKFLLDEEFDKYLIGFVLGKPHYTVEGSRAVRQVQQAIIRQKPELRKLSVEEAITKFGPQIRLTRNEVRVNRY